MSKQKEEEEEQAQKRIADEAMSRADEAAIGMRIHTTTGSATAKFTSADLVKYLDQKPQSKPMVTRAQYERARAVLDALPPGFYVHCSECNGWYDAEDNARLELSRLPARYLCGGCA